MMPLLLPVDGSGPSNRAVEHVVALHATGFKGEVFLLNVQPKRDSRSRDEKRAQAVAQFDAAERASRSAVALLEKAGIAFKTYTRFGSPAEVILNVARQKRCSQIVMGTRGLGAVTRLLLGSVAMKVLQLAPIPVTLVK